eukprot:jgi/Chlat1/6187/Chrsp42S05734
MGGGGGGDGGDREAFLFADVGRDAAEGDSEMLYARGVSKRRMKWGAGVPSATAAWESVRTASERLLPVRRTPALRLQDVIQSSVLYDVK